MREDLVRRNYAQTTIRTYLMAIEEFDSANNLFHYAMLLTMYSAGLRRSKLCRLKVSNIDSPRIVIRVERGKGGLDPEIPLSRKLLETLRTYWRWMRERVPDLVEG